MKPPIEASAQHGVVNTFRSGRGPDKYHSRQVGKGFIGMDIGSGFETAYSGRPHEPLVFIFDYEDISVCHHQQVNKFAGNPQAVKRTTYDRQGRRVVYLELLLPV